VDVAAGNVDAKHRCRFVKGVLLSCTFYLGLFKLLMCLFKLGPGRLDTVLLELSQREEMLHHRATALDKTLAVESDRLQPEKTNSARREAHR
jgi:hypothetical protein